MLEFEVVYFVTDTGMEPFKEWLLALEKTDRATVAGRIERVRRGLLGDCKSLGSGVFELRIHKGPGYRVYFGIEGNTMVVLLLGGNKSTQKKDISKAKAYWQEWVDG